MQHIGYTLEIIIVKCIKKITDH